MVNREFYKKNKTRITNDFLNGEPDLSDNEDIKKAKIIIDTKASWDIFTFFKSKYEPLNKDYFWQGQSYMALTGAETFKLVYCLVNTPDHLVQDEKRKLAWKMGLIDADINQNYLEACKELDKLAVYDDIPKEERIHEIIIQRDDSSIERLYERINICREWMSVYLYKNHLSVNQ